jgi:hypothetical protein
MILTKRQIIDIELKKVFGDDVPQFWIKKEMSKPEVEFVKYVNKQYNWTLESIGKNRYIITAGQYTNWLALKLKNNNN